MSHKLVLDISHFSSGQVAQILTFVNELEAVQANSDRPMVDLQNIESTGWMATHVELLRTGLEERVSLTQLAVFDAAIENGGYVSRKEVYAIGHYSPERSLKRWTMPFSSLQKNL